MNISSPDFIKHAWEVLALFLIPIGGGIPAGVVLGQKYGFEWTFTTFLYLISDLILAMIFEPIMLWFIEASKKSPKLDQVRKALAESTRKVAGRYKSNPTPFTLILLTFGTDPMTGRSIAKTAGHGFFSGWTLVICGDMIFYFVLMGSTLWLNNLLGDGTMAALIVTVAILAFPWLLDKMKGKKAA